MREFRKPRDGEVLSYITRVTRGFRVFGTEIQFYPCPKCGKANSKNPSCKINSNNGLWRCYSCGATGGFYSLSLAFGDAIENPYKDEEAYLPNTFLTSKYKGTTRRPVTGGHYPDLLEYCHSRGISNDTLNAFRVTTKGQYGLRFPLYDWVNDKWELVNAKVKFINPEAKTKEMYEYAGGATKILFGINLIDYSARNKRIIITEGQFDAMAGYEIGFRNIFSLPNGGNSVDCSKMLHHIPDDWSIWLASDMDSTGDIAYENFLAQVGYDRVKRMKLPYKDLNEWLIKEPNLSMDDVESTIASEGLMDFNKSKFAELSFDMDYTSERDLAAKTPFKELNEILGGGLWSGQTTGLLAPSGAGKSSFCNHLACYVADGEVDVGLISLEGTRTSLMSNLQGIIKAISDEPKKTAKHLKISKLFGTTTTIENITAEITEMISIGVKLIIVDNLDFICRTDHVAKSNAYKEIIDLAAKSGTHIICVWQPNKIDRKQVINSGNQKGFSQFYQDADNYWVLNKQEGGCTLSIEKNREVGIVDLTLSFEFDTATRVFRICDKEQKKKTNVIDFLGVRDGNKTVSASC